MKFDCKISKDFLEIFNKSDISSKNFEKNIFEIAGYPHYENIVSNILAFFFDSEEEHGFRDLWIKSLINCYIRKMPNDEINGDVINTYNVEREYSNSSGKRIDLLIDCSSFLVLIENKIYAPLYNDLDVYTDIAKNYLKITGNEEIPIVKVVLSLFEVENIKWKDVVNITYEELFNELEKNKLFYQTNNKWQVLNDEFMESIKRRKINMHINEKWAEFAKENIDSVTAFLDTYKNDCIERLDFCKDLTKKIKEIDNSLVCGTYKGGQNTSYYSVYLDIKLKDGTIVVIETYIMKRPSKEKYEDYTKIYVALWARERKSFDYLRRLVETANVKEAKAHKTDAWNEQYILETLAIDNVDINSLAKTIADYAQRIIKGDQ